jgi:hypothetical protein
MEGKKSSGVIVSTDKTSGTSRDRCEDIEYSTYGKFP